MAPISAKVLVKARGLKSLPSAPLHGEDWKEADHGGHYRGEDGATDLAAGVEDNLCGWRRGVVMGCLAEAAETVFAEHDPQVDDGADGDGDAGESDDVGVDVEELHGDEGYEHSQREHERDEKRAAQVPDKEKDDEDGDEGLVEESGSQSGDGFVDQVAAGR